MQPDAVLLTTSEVADRYRVHPNTIRRWVRQGKISAITIPAGGRMKRYRKADVEAVLADDSAGAA